MQPCRILVLPLLNVTTLTASVSRSNGKLPPSTPSATGRLVTSGARCGRRQFSIAPAYAGGKRCHVQQRQNQYPAGLHSPPVIRCVFIADIFSLRTVNPARLEGEFWDKPNQSRIFTLVWGNGRRS